MNQRLSNVKKNIQKEFAKQKIEFQIVEWREKGEQSIVAYSTDFGFGMFSDRKVDEVTFFVLIQEKEDENESEYIETNMNMFVKILCGIIDKSELAINFKE